MKLKPFEVQGGEEIQEDLPKYEGIQIVDVRPGVKMWENPINKYTVIRVHYSADPKKRTKVWREEARAGIPFAEWMREYEIVWSAFEGVPVFAESYSKSFHVSESRLQWAMDYPVIRGWDFGLDVLGMACLFTQLLPSSRLFIYHELVATDSDIYTFAEAVRQYSLEWFPGCKRFFDIVDPSGFNRDARNRSKKSYCDVLRDELHCHPIPGAKSTRERIQAVTKFLTTAVRGLPKVWIDHEECPTLVEGFDGGYHYPYAKDGQVKDVPEKNLYSHIQDCLQMICTRCERLDVDGERMVEIPTPRYNFGR